jgi:Fic family protein
VPSIQAARELIINSPLIPAWEKQLQREALIKQTHHTTSIEGNQLTLEELSLLVDGKDVLVVRWTKKKLKTILMC